MSERRLRIGVAGAAGRMGRALIGATAASPDLELVVAIEAAASPLVGSDAGAVAGTGASGVRIEAGTGRIGELDVLVDFTRPGPTLEHLAACREAGVRAVVGTTGFSDEERQRIAAIGADIAMVLSPNMSVGVNVAYRLIDLAARVLGDDVDVEVIEAHHRHKVDAPSGTAVRIGEVLARALGRDLAECAVYGREGHTGERPRRQIGFETIRGGDIVGEHTVLFAGTGERLEVTHRASSRDNFAYGALRAARWVMGRPNGVFDMQDVLGLG